MPGCAKPAVRLAAYLFSVIAILALASCAGTVRDTRRNFTTVVIDAGHGGHDSGARSRRGTREKDVNLDVARRLDSNLRNVGLRTIMTRHDDRFIPLAQRAAISNTQRKAVFVSVHFNWSPKSSVRGVETYYSHPYGRNMAQSIQKSLVSGGIGPHRGVKHARFHVLRNNKNPAALLELGFLSNASDDSLAKNPAYRQHLADLITRGLLEMRGK